MVAPSDMLEPDEPIDGEVLTEQDLVDADDCGITLPDGVDHDWLLGELWKDLLRGEHARAVLAEAEQRRIIELNRSLEHRMIEGIGQIRARVSLDTYLHWTSRYGPDFWRQEDSLKFFADRNPGFLVDTFRRKTTVVVDRDLDLPACSGAPAFGGNGVGEKPVAGAKTAPATVPARQVRSRGRGRWAS